MKGALLEATDRSCGWTKRPARHKHGCGMMLVMVLVRSKNYEGVDTRNEKYLETKNKATTAVYQGKFKREGKVIQRNVIQRDDQNCDVLNIAEDS